MPIVDGLIEPVNLRYAAGPGSGPMTVPAVMTDLSAGGMSFVLFCEPPHAKVLEMDLNLPGLEHIPIEGRILWVKTKGSTHVVGIAFVKIRRKDQERIGRMAADYTDCETRIALRLPEVCVRECTFHSLCQKAQKQPLWPA
jgi:hypothetical protein